MKLTGSKKKEIHEGLMALLAEINEITDPSLEEPSCIIVEGPKDVLALRELGIQGVIIQIYGNQTTIVDVEKKISERKYRSVIILTDYDYEGKVLAKKLEEYLIPFTTINFNLRLRLQRLTGGWIGEIESLPHFISRLVV
ncbi:MAG: toprim domain-containing protein [Candidatus Ranarchaeia archaeon]